MKKKIILLIAMISTVLSMMSVATATVRIVYDDDGESRTYYEDEDRYYFYEDGERCYYDKYGSKKCVDYDDGDYKNYEDRYWNWCSYRDYNSSRDVCYYSSDDDDDDDYDYDSTDLDYSFGHYPVSDLDISYHWWVYPYIKYEWYVSGSPRKISSATLNEVFDFIKDTWYFKFFKFSYYWDSTLEKVDNGEIDLDYLYKTKLSYPIVWVYLKKDVLLFIHKDNLTEEDKDTIWRNYYEDDLKITRSGSWYIVYLPTARDTGSFTYDQDKYLKTFRKVYNNYTLLNFQVWENPFQIYYIEDFGNNIMQMEVKKGSKLVWTIVSMEKTYFAKPVSNSTKYGKEYSNDEIMQQNLEEVHTAVKKYYFEMGFLPNTLGTMNYQYIDFKSLNPYNYDLKFYTTSVVCYKIGFKPTSVDFKSYHENSLDANGYFMTEMCVR